MSNLNIESKVFKPKIDVYVDRKPICERLLHLSMRTGYPCIQRNGQRYYGPPPNWDGIPPEKGSEIFIGHLPCDCFEDELVPIFETVAPIFELRMMLNFTGYNRGFAFITYFNSNDAWRAIRIFNNYEIRPGHKLGISKSVDNCRLYIGGIPFVKSKAEIWEELTTICSTVKEIIMYPNPEDRKTNRGFLFAELEDPRTAAMAKRMMAPGTIKLWNQEVIVDWADPEPDVDPSIMATITKLFLRNITPSFTIDAVRRILQEVVPMSAVRRIYGSTAGHYAFVHFDTRVHAQLAKDRLSVIHLEGEMLEVHWARPKYFRKTSNSHCRSLPPRFRRNRLPPQREPSPQQDQEFMVLPMVTTPVQHVPTRPVQNVPIPLQNTISVQNLVQIPAVEINNNFEGRNPLPSVHQYATVQYPYYPTPQIIYPQNTVPFYTQ